MLAELEKAPPAFEVVSLHPAILKRYEEQLDSLQGALAEGMRSGDRECAEAIRELVETVTVYRDPSEPGAVEIEIAGRLNSILGDRAYPNPHTYRKYATGSRSFPKTLQHNGTYGKEAAGCVG